MISGMTEMTRRDFGFTLAALSTLAAQLTTTAPEADAQESKPLLTRQRTFHFDQLPVKTNAAGGESRAVLQGTLPTGEFLECHETMVQPGQMPHPAHQHEHSELILIREGRMEYYNEGATEGPLGPGDVIFSASNKLHGMKNIGTTPAKYFVVAIGVQKANMAVPR
jgi:mannose-6-phosphate isomerase-like protein (cupin superfamily)